MRKIIDVNSNKLAFLKSICVTIGFYDVISMCAIKKLIHVQLKVKCGTTKLMWSYIVIICADDNKYRDSWEFTYKYLINNYC